MSRLSILCLLLLTLASNQAYAGFDHELPLDQNGIWARSYQTGLENGVIALEVAGPTIPTHGSRAAAIKVFQAVRSLCRQAS
jgi:hypothetical protein